ncbi:UNVERIFIED_CONTAM: hypothetical protein Sradi_6952900 [Sesamum radiatum]|uniref:DUF4283 domain-containing protein n=1 Tax=Sesamum radiatum TaxID=300843 RepID=A0AAW2JFD8_SESRA
MDVTTIIFSDTETQSLAEDLRYAHVGKFSHGSPQYSQLHRLLSNSGIKEAFIVSLINNKHALINLTNESDYSRLWMKRIWYLKGLPMRVFKWSPTFIPDQESSIVPVWVSFPDLSAHLFRKDALHTIAKFVGVPLQIADSTFSWSMLSRARVCIEIDLLKPLVKEFDLQINGRIFVQKVEKCTKPPPPRRAFGTNEATNVKQMKEKTVIPNDSSASKEKGECSKTNESCQLIIDESDELAIDEVDVAHEAQIIDVENEAQIIDVMPENDACFVENETLVEHAIVYTIENENENENVEVLERSPLPMMLVPLEL